MENMQQTYLNLFKLDVHGIGHLPLIASEENIQSAITAWSTKAIECLQKDTLTEDEEKFFYDYVDLFSKQKHIENEAFFSIMSSNWYCVYI